jgi:RHS repeat-associated protein
LSETANGVGRTFQYNALNQLVSSSDTAATNAVYQWDAEQRLVGIIQGTNQSQFFYDGLGKRLKIVEISGGVPQTERRFIWSDLEICEEHNSNDVVVNRYFDQGEQQNGTNLFYTLDHLGSIRELNDSTAAVRAEYAYSPYGSPTKVGGNLEPNFGFTGQFRHMPSGLNLTFYRAYDARNARWISRDPIEEVGGINLYDYVLNDPANDVDDYGDSCEECLEKTLEVLHLAHKAHKIHEMHEVAKKAAEIKPPTKPSGILHGLSEETDTLIDWAGTQSLVVKATAKHLKNAAQEHVVDPAKRKFARASNMLAKDIHAFMESMQSTCP